MIRKLALLLIFVLSTQARAQNMEDFTVKNIYFHMGVIAAFAEVVNMEVKQIGLSEMFSAEEADKWEPVVKHIAERNDVQYYRENDFLVTDLFDPARTEGKTLFIIYKGDTLEKYQALKKKKAELIAAGHYDKAARRDIATAFGRLLDYSDAVINRLTEKDTPKN